MFKNQIKCKYYLIKNITNMTVNFKIRSCVNIIKNIRE